MISFIFTGLFPAVGVVIIMQDTIVGEKREGTASWVLSKPLTRLAFVLSKVIANSVGVMVTMIIVPFCISFTIIAIVHKSLLTPIRFHRSHGSGIHQPLFLSIADLDAGHIFSTTVDRSSVFPWLYYSCNRISLVFCPPCVIFSPGTWLCPSETQTHWCFRSPWEFQCNRTT